jgi:phospholipid/cholesterol/gamma-HCH transport system ATP-binding protein
VGIGIQVEGLTKSFGAQRIWEDVTMEIPAGEVRVLLGPSGTGKSAFLKSFIGVLRRHTHRRAVPLVEVLAQPRGK